MAQQLKKKFIGNDQIDGTKIQLLKDQSIRIENQAGHVINLLQLSADDKVLAKGEEIGLKSEIDAEVQRATDEEQRIEGLISDEEARALAAEGVLQGNIDDEVTRAEGEEERIEGRLNTEISNRGLEITRVEGLVSAEKDRAEGQEAAIRTEFAAADDAIKGVLVEGDYSTVKALSDALKAVEGDVGALGDTYATDEELADEAAAIRVEFAAADTTLQGNIDAEQTRALAAEVALQDNIDDEVDARIAADTALQNQINDIISNVDPSALDSLSEIVTAFQNADNDLSAAITAALGTHTSELAAETAARIAADSAIQADVDANEAAAAIDRAAIRTEFAAADTALHATISAEIDADVLVEKQRAEIEEAAIRTDFATADSAIQTELNATQVGAGLEADGSYVADELSYYIYEATSLKDADAKLDAKLAEEVSNLQSEDFTMLKLDGSRSMYGDLNMLNESIQAVGFSMPAQIPNENDPSIVSIEAFHGVDGTEQYFLDEISGEVFTVVQFEYNPVFDAYFFTLDNPVTDYGGLTTGLTKAELVSVSSKIVGLADGVDAGDAVNKGQLDAAVSAAASDVSDLQDEFDAYVTSNNAALADEVSARETLEGEFDAYVTSNNTALAQEVSDREAADTALQVNIDVEKGRIDAILLAADADKDSFAEIVTLINSIDAENDSAFGGHVLNYNQYVEDNDARVLAVEGEVDTLQSEMDAVEDRATTLESEMDSAEGRLDQLEAVTWTMETITIDANTVGGFSLQNMPIPLSVQVFVGRLAVHMNEDYLLDPFDPQAIMFVGDLAAGGVSAIAEGDVIYVKYQYVNQA